MALTDEQLRIKAEIEAAREKVTLANRELAQVLVKHECIVSESSQYGGAWCALCHCDLGWWCPKAPTNVCEYSVDNDSCDYCGCPDERK